MSSRLIPPNVGEIFLTVSINSSIFLVSISISKTSISAIEIAKKIYPDNKKVKYINGFAEEEISKLKLTKPTFFSTMCCLAHLEDDDVLGIIKTIDKIAPLGSVLACSEPWGDFYYRECWNIRPPEWWSDTLANWEFEFYNDYILTDPPGRSKGFIATRL